MHSTMQYLQKFKNHNGLIHALIIHPDENGNRCLYSGGTDGRIRKWNTKTQTSTKSGSDRLETVWCFTIFNNYLYSCHDGIEDNIKKWHNNQCIQSLNGHDGSVFCLTTFIIKIDETYLCSGSIDKTIKMWDKDGKCVRTMVGHEQAVRCLATTRNEILYSGSWDGSIMKWNKYGIRVNTLRGHNGSVRCLAYDQNQNQLFSGGRDNKIRIWDQNDNCVQILSEHTNWVKTIALGNQHPVILYSGSSDDTLRVWYQTNPALFQNCDKIKRKNEIIEFILVDGDNIYISTDTGVIRKYGPYYPRDYQNLPNSQKQKIQQWFLTATNHLQIHKDIKYLFEKELLT